MSTENIQPINVLRYLNDPKCKDNPDDSLVAEYRLLCSGSMFRRFRSGWYDWRKSETGRILLDEPLLLFAVSRPFEDYPLELVLQLAVPLVREESHSVISSYHPDAEVAKDLAALLGLLCRRLITVAGKTNERHLTSCYKHPLFDNVPMPTPLATTMRRICWPQHPSMVLTSLEKQEIEDYNPRPRPVDAAKLTRLLLGLPRLTVAPSIVASTRLYALALELIHERPDISYQLLISSVETIASSVLSDFQPDDEAKVKHRQGVFELAVRFGLEEEPAKELAVEACKGDYWIKRKFKKFLLDNTSELIWSEEDDLFPRAFSMLMPQRDAFERTLGQVYDARSKATHVGQPFPVTASHTGSPYLPTGMATTLMRSKNAGHTSVFPPVIWFERVVNSAITGYWERSLEGTESPSIGDSSCTESVPQT